MGLLQFSESFLNAEYVEHSRNRAIEQPTIVFNVSPTTEMQIDDTTIAPRQSGIFQQATIREGDAAVLITSAAGFSAIEPNHHSKAHMMERWTHVHDIFPLPHLRETALWRSAQERIGNIGFNMWFAGAGTNCGIHNKHDFLEVHTQVWGTGHMQKFHENNESRLYSDIFMTPGYTHAPFCGDDRRYPWHRYFADTDCVWLAVEYS